MASSEMVARNPRKASTYGGSRAWSEEEESFLLESRHRKTPYKHIAQSLQKTELACRLHYHQLAYGTKRKRRNNSTSSGSTSYAGSNLSMAGTTREHTPRKSIDSNSSQFSLQAPPLTAVPDFSPPSSPTSSNRVRRARSESPQNEHQLASGGAFISATSAISHAEKAPHFQHHQRIVAPLGPPLEMDRRRSSCSLISIYPQDGDHSRQLADIAGGVAMARNTNFSFTGTQSTSALPTFGGFSDPTHIDPARLGNCYKAHRHAFWREVAREYGGNASPQALEAAFLRQNALSPVSSLPTPPNRSPVLVPAVTAEDVDAKARSGDKGISHQQNGASCSIASILTDDQEVWSRRSQTV